MSYLATLKYIYTVTPMQKDHYPSTNDSQPESLYKIPGLFLRPLRRVQLCLPTEKIGLFGWDPSRLLEELPEQYESEEERKSNIRRDKARCAPSAGNVIESIEDGHDTKVSQGYVRRIRLE